VINKMHLFFQMSRYFFLIAACLLWAASSAMAAEPLRVTVSIAPQAYFIQRIGGELVDVNVLVPPGKSPALYNPTPRQMAALARSRLFFRIGLPFENGIIAKISGGTKVKIVDTRQGIELLPVASAGTASGELDPHIWMDPMLAKTLSQTMRDALIDLDSANGPYYERGFRNLATDLDSLDGKLRLALQPLAGRTVYVFHPAFGYFCRAYGLVQKAVESGGKEPGIRQLTKLIRDARRDGVKVIFVQPQFPKKSAEAVARAIQGTVVVLDPLAGDYIANLQRVAALIGTALR